MGSTHRLIELPERIDARGALVFAQQGDEIPFPIKRFFALHGLSAGARRGDHAHRRQHQLLVMLAGGVTVTVDDGKRRTAVRLDRPSAALHIPPMLWLELEDFSADAVCMVLTSDLYSEADYIRDRGEFLRLTEMDCR